MTDVSGAKVRGYIGKGLLASAAVMVLIGVAFLTGFVTVASESRLLVGGALVAVGVIDGFLGLRFLGESG
jgi:hypothetical protein